MTQQPPSGPRCPDCRGFIITLRHTTLGRNSLDQWSARRSDLHLTTLNAHKIQVSIPSAGFETAIPANERPQRTLGSAEIISWRKFHWTQVTNALISSFRPVLNIVCFILGNSPAYEFYMPIYKTQTRGITQKKEYNNERPLNPNSPQFPTSSSFLPVSAPILPDYQFSPFVTSGTYMSHLQKVF